MTCLTAPLWLKAGLNGKCGARGEGCCAAAPHVRTALGSVRLRYGMVCAGSQNGRQHRAATTLMPSAPHRGQQHWQSAVWVCVAFGTGNSISAWHCIVQAEVGSWCQVNAVQ